MYLIFAAVEKHSIYDENLRKNTNSKIFGKMISYTNVVPGLGPRIPSMDYTM